MNDYEVEKVYLKTLVELVPDAYKFELINVLISSLIANETINISNFEDSIRLVLDYAEHSK